jgi:hypothetical protein
MIPDMTTGIRDFMIRSGLNVPTPEIPIPDLAVPYAAPIDPKIIADAIPAKEKKGANFGVYSLADMVPISNRGGWQKGERKKKLRIESSNTYKQFKERRTRNKIIAQCSSNFEESRSWYVD